MSEPFYVARATVRRVEGTHRRASIDGAPDFDMGVHGAVKAHYKLDDEKNLPLPVDYIVAATGT